MAFSTDRSFAAPSPACGVAEGFYGRPWSARQRRQLFAWMRSWRMNTYLYAPKDDLKHRTLWRARYTEREAGELRDLMRECRNQGLGFIYAIAPGLDIRYSRKKEAAALRRKASQLLTLGCRQFALLFDDIQPVLSDGDARAFDSTAAAQARVANDLLDFLRGQAPATGLFFCPTAYCQRMSGPPRRSDYLQQLGKLLDPAIQVFWTGPEIVSETITAESIRELRQSLRRKPVIWDNLHANDYDQRRVYLGPYAGRPAALREETKGILSNPNCELEANYIPLLTLARYARARGAWNPRRAYQAGLRSWLPRWETHGSKSPVGSARPGVPDRFPAPARPVAGKLARCQPPIRAELFGDHRFVRQDDCAEESRTALRALPACLGIAGGSHLAAELFSLAKERPAAGRAVQRPGISPGNISRRFGSTISAPVADG
ncbi:MAG: hypothetical protein E6L09_12825 [Verrucomicrobia bacterium]|nr:MAG: hypothetical protein E6L09_12825 [Verrucomicrobiota bacterium]